MVESRCQFNSIVGIILILVAVFALTGSWPVLAQAEEKEYRGTATVTIEYWDYDGYGNSVYQKTETYQREVNVYVNPPSTCESFRESNPFNLMISTEGDPSNPLDGEFLISSGGSFSSPQLFEGCVLLQYWTFTVDGDSIRGTLMDTHDAEGMVLNSLWAWQEISPGFGTAWPYTMETGSTLEGTIDESEARLLIQGNSKCRTRPFTAEVLAIRVK